jgi:hypothetical protein
MNARLLASISGFVLLSALTPLALANRTRELRPQKIGSGWHDYYSLASFVGDQPAQYLLTAAIKRKLDLATATAQIDGAPVKLHASGAESAYGQKFPWVSVELSRAQCEKGQKWGSIIYIDSSKGHVAFSIPAEQFRELLRDADLHDEHARKQRAAAEAAEREAKLAAEAAARAKLVLELAQRFQPEDVLGYAARGTGKISGQAFLKTRGGEVRVGAGNAVQLLPAKAWFYAALAFHWSEFPDATRAQLAPFMRVTQADAQGNFEFSDLPPGDYLLHTLIEWEVPGAYGATTTGGPVQKRVSIQSEPVRVMLTM